ncbi:hypothetical protein BT96DRAFT_978845 [Gymnopus androsaceus JB14]|uniref:Uncharacterized protein n=1 Tax=Gymnopus androsaceus JB14 TaxID=1447944 RepID=A0A6A4H623_9AGAR|nr:hypothetical protein BT96DRAFT_978845 [Gymnopus androsaceus JB14]
MIKTARKSRSAFSKGKKPQSLSKIEKSVPMDIFLRELHEQKKVLNTLDEGEAQGSLNLDGRVARIFLEASLNPEIGNFRRTVQTSTAEIYQAIFNAQRRTSRMAGMYEEEQEMRSRVPPPSGVLNSAPAKRFEG